MEPAELVGLIVAHGGAVPPDRLTAVSQRIEAFGAQKAPSTLNQRRVFVGDWLQRQLKESGALGLGGSTPRVAWGGAGQHVVLGAGQSPPAAPPNLVTSPPIAAGGLRTPRDSPRATLAPGGGGVLLPPSAGLESALSAAEEALLAARIGELVEPNGRLNIPPELVPRLTSDVTLALGKHRSPPSLSARRRLIEDCNHRLAETPTRA